MNQPAGGCFAQVRQYGPDQAGCPEQVGFELRANQLYRSVFQRSGYRHSGSIHNGVESSQLANNLTGGMVPGGIAGMPSGPIADVGDEAMQSMTLLTARKGDYTVMVQIIPTNMMSFLTDSTAARALFEKEKTIARKTLAKL